MLNDIPGRLILDEPQVKSRSNIRPVVPARGQANHKTEYAL